MIHVNADGIRLPQNRPNITLLCTHSADRRFNEKDDLVKTLLLSLGALAALATAATAAPLADTPARSQSRDAAAIPVADETLPNHGKVLEMIAAGKYTYLRVATGGKEKWLAILRHDVPVGTEIAFADGMLMTDFHSSTLDRTFDEVVFLGGVTVEGEKPSAVPQGHPPITGQGGAGETAPSVPPGHPPLTGQEDTAATLPNEGKVSEAIAAGNYTYLHVRHDGKGTWLAIPRREIAVGTEIRYADGMLMKDFHSSSLDRTFEEVVFLGGVIVKEE